MSEDQEVFNRMSLNQQVALRLLKTIRSQNQAGDRLPSEAALSKQLGVSVLTLREALSVLAHRGFIERRHGAGTFVLDPTASQWIAIATSLDLSHPNLSYFHRRVPYLIRALLMEKGIKARIYSGSIVGSPSRNAQGDLTPDQAGLPATLFEDIENDLIRAVVLLGDDKLSYFEKLGIPIISNLRGVDSYSVSLPSGDFYLEAVKFMASRGCRTVALLDWKQPSHEQWDEVLTAFKMSSRPEWMASANYSVPASGFHTFHALWNAHEEKPDCVIVVDDILFREVSLAILSERIEVPRELKVLTHYNKGSRILLPFPCVTYEVDPDLLAKEFVNLCLLALAPNAPKSKHIQIPFEIVEHSPS